MASIIKRSYKATLPDGKVVTRKCDHWTIQYRDAAGKIKRVKGYTDKQATKQLAAKLEKAQARGEQGLVDYYREPKARPILDHVGDYVAELRSTGRDDEYSMIVEKRLAKLADGCGWKNLADIEPNSFCQWREREKKEHVAPGRMDKGASAETLNQFLETVRAFLNWCAETKRIEGVPVPRRGKYGRTMMALALAGVAKVEGEKRRKRRALSDEQVQNLLRAAGDRALCYRVGLSIGLRRGEIEALVWGDLHLTAIRPYAQLRAEATKARRGDRLDLPRTLADDLRQHRPTAAKDCDLVFPDMPDIEQWKADLAAAKIPYKDEMGRQADFHGGTRKTLNSRMAKSGVPLAVAMRRMRHTDPKLTSVDYIDEQAIGMETGCLSEIIAPPMPAATAANG